MMFDPEAIPAVDRTETVTRYLMFARWYRASDQTIKHEAFIPPDDLELSVTRLRELTEDEIWNIGRQVAGHSQRQLHGRADLAVTTFLAQQLDVQADPVPHNPNHARVVGWPVDKAQRMMVAKQIAATPGLRRIPPPDA